MQAWHVAMHLALTLHTPWLLQAEEENMDEGMQARRRAKPADWRAMFSGNTDDHFRLGIKITRGAIRCACARA